jgi:hypothetical protein
MRKARRVALVLAVFALVVPNITAAAPVVFSASGPDAGAIAGGVDAFRNALGTDNVNAPGPLPGGRREINWDGGGAATTVSPTPFTGFLNIRGALFETPGTGFVQAPPDGLVTTFTNPTYTAFLTFSPLRLFSAISSNVTDTNFFVPGTNGGIPATVSAFGAVFSDVDLQNSAGVQYFDAAGNSLGTFFAPPFAGGLSFIGVSFTEGAIVDRVRLTSGNVAPGPNDAPGVDVVFMDNFIYSEPTPVPEPSVVLLTASGAAGLAAWARRRRRTSRSSGPGW